MDLLSSVHGLLTSSCWYFLLSLVVLVVVGYLGSPLIIWSIVTLLLLVGWGVPHVLTAVVAVVLVVFNIKPIRRILISAQIVKVLRKILPKISETEKTALDAGVVWVEADLFSGKPNMKKLMSEPYAQLTKEEQAFMDGPVNELCALVDDWKIWKTREIEQKVWDYIKKEKFFGMIIPKQYGGLEFSAFAHSEVVMKLASRSISTCITVMVPNSLGPAELLSHYGTQKQKDYYLPRLARGEEIPCFGLTEPGAGSDAGSITASGVLFKKDGKLMMRLNWNKRYITLAAASTIIGLAFKLRDPENLLGKGEDLGITCALIPGKTPGVVLGRRHDPLGVPFFNCPTQGHDVEVVVEDTVVGGVDGVGRGWKMLMECLAAGRGISLPAQSVGGTKLVTRVTSAYSVVRKQFGVNIGKFEGIEEPIARIAGYNYGLEAMRRYTCGALDQGIKPAVITAIAKHYATEAGRKVINDGMDIVGGAGISLGSRNLLAGIYTATPIGITVEGANILTRTLIIFGQGALRAHPYAYKEVVTAESNDVVGFDNAFWGHIGHVVRNTFRSIVLSVTRGYIYLNPISKDLAKYERRLVWSSASFAILSDIAMGSLGGSLKLKEKITGRYADILAWMYIATAVIRRYEFEGQKKEDLIYAKYILKFAMTEIQKSFDGIFDNLDVPGLSWFFKGWLGAWSRINSLGSLANDSLGKAVAESIQNNVEVREALTGGIYIPTDIKQSLGRLENAYKLVLGAEKVEHKIRLAIKAKQIAKNKNQKALVEAALASQIITNEEANLLAQADEARRDAIQVDDFDEAGYKANTI